MIDSPIIINLNNEAILDFLFFFFSMRGIPSNFSFPFLYHLQRFNFRRYSYPQIFNLSNYKNNICFIYRYFCFPMRNSSKSILFTLWLIQRKGDRVSYKNGDFFSPSLFNFLLKLIRLKYRLGINVCDITEFCMHLWATQVLRYCTRFSVYKRRRNTK